jgi:hypothetical protein
LFGFGEPARIPLHHNLEMHGPRRAVEGREVNRAVVEVAELFAYDFDTYRLPDESLGDPPRSSATPKYSSVRTELPYEKVFRIFDLWGARRERPRRWLIETRWCPQLQGMVRSFLVVHARKPIETPLLRRQVASRWVDFLFFQGAMHSLVASVLIWTSWLDTNRLYTKFDEPY